MCQRLGRSVCSELWKQSLLFLVCLIFFLNFNYMAFINLPFFTPFFYSYFLSYSLIFPLSFSPSFLFSFSQAWKLLLELWSSLSRKWWMWWFWPTLLWLCLPSLACSYSWGTCATSVYAGPFRTALWMSTTPHWPTTPPSSTTLLTSQPTLKMKVTYGLIE